jgi:serine protease Do
MSEASKTALGSIVYRFQLFFVFFVLIALLIPTLRFIAPGIVEQIQYAATRGRQRAEFEIAGEELEKSGLSELSQSYEMVMKRIGPSVVHIVTSGRSLSSEGSENGSSFGSLVPHELRGMGSGIIVDSDGLVLTNLHVVADADDIKVTLSDDREKPARVVGIDEKTDLALLKISEQNLISAVWNDRDIREGALVWAVGSPFGLLRTISSGIISATNRSRISGKTNQTLLQTDVPLNPGNSGGPLVDADGCVVGINTAIHGPEFRGISFAIPSRVAKAAYQQMRSENYPARGYLGVGMDLITPEKAAELGIKSAGVLVREVRCSEHDPTPAQSAGVRVGDVIVAWNEQSVKTPEQLSALVAATEIGSNSKLTIIRGKKEIVLDVEVRARPLQIL